VLTRILTGHGNLHGPNMALRKSAWKKVKVHTDDRQVHEDIDLACHLATQGTIHYLRGIPVTYSLRRIKRAPIGTAIEYTIRYFRTILLHHPSWLHKNEG
jgi:hypothetical protein